VRWLRARDKAGRVLALPNQARGALAHYGLTRAEVDREVWAIDARGRRFSGAPAVNQTLACLGGLWRCIAAIERVPGALSLEARAYSWVANNRRRFPFWSTTPECEEANVNCE
jgi:predicted DCC family thiol-disulfide oxidoreductase YuxK